MALFLDRPLADGALLLASEAFSRSIAEQRLRDLAREPNALTELEQNQCLPRLAEGTETRGLPLDAVGGDARPGSVSLTDARKAAPDFVLLRTTPGSVRALMEQVDFTQLVERTALDFLKGGQVLLARDTSGTVLVVYDEQLRPRLKWPLQAPN